MQPAPPSLCGIRRLRAATAPRGAAPGTGGHCRPHATSPSHEIIFAHPSNAPGSRHGWHGSGNHASATAAHRIELPLLQFSPLSLPRSLPPRRDRRVHIQKACIPELELNRGTGSDHYGLSGGERARQPRVASQLSSGVCCGQQQRGCLHPPGGGRGGRHDSDERSKVPWRGTLLLEDAIRPPEWATC